MNQVANTWDAYMAPWEDEFTEKNKYGLSFESECHFAKQILMKNSGVLSAAQKNPQSLHDAIVNSSAIGISLNPASKHAYLVPRDGAVCLDISYIGMTALACDSGAISLAKAVLVHGKRGTYPGDHYTGRGPITAPTHEYDLTHPDRVNGADPLENLLCGYCVAVLPSGVLVVEEMSAAEIFAVRASSKAYSSGRACPWKGAWSGEMAKKTLIKRAAKTWPQTGNRERLDMAISVLNEHEGLREVENPNPAQVEAAPRAAITHEQAEDLGRALQVAGLSSEAFCRKAGIAALDQLPEARLAGAKQFLQQRTMRLGND